MPNKKEPLSLIVIKTLLAVIIFTGIGTIIIGGGLLIGERGRVLNNEPVVNKDCKELNEEECIKNLECEPMYIYPIVGGKQYVACNKKDTEPIAKQKVIITTDKTEYEREETVEITVRNNLDKSIWYSGKPSFGCSNAFDLGMKENKTYKEFYSLGTSWCISPILELKSKSEQVFDLELSGDFNQWLEIYDVYGIKLPEDFKLRFSYGFNGENLAEEEIYSNEFTIKEKSALDPGCGEKVKGDNGCGAQWFGYEFDQGKEICVTKVVVGCSFETPFKTLEECQEVCEKGESNIPLIWRKFKDGQWVMEDMTCMKKGTPPSYLCGSNCYEKSNEKIWQLCESKGSVTYTNTGVEVLCFPQSCFPEPDISTKECELVCPG